MPHTNTRAVQASIKALANAAGRHTNDAAAARRRATDPDLTDDDRARARADIIVHLTEADLYHAAAARLRAQLA